MAQEHDDAVALVTVNRRRADNHPASGTIEETVPSHATDSPGKEQIPRNEHLLRAKELVDLHRSIKAKHANGQVDEELARAREEVRRVLRELDASK